MLRCADVMKLMDGMNFIIATDFDISVTAHS